MSRYMTEDEHVKGVELFDYFYVELRRIVNEKLVQEKVPVPVEEFVRAKLSEDMRFWD